MIVKQRPEASKIDRMDLIGQVEGRDCIIVDDMIDTAGTLCKAADVLKENGAKRVYAYATHGLFNEPAPSRISKSALDEVIVTDSVPLRQEARDYSDGKIK